MSLHMPLRHIDGSWVCGSCHRRFDVFPHLFSLERRQCPGRLAEVIPLRGAR